MSKFSFTLFLFLLINFSTSYILPKKFFSQQFSNDDTVCAKFSCINDTTSPCFQSDVSSSGEVSVQMNPICSKNQSCSIGGNVNDIIYDGQSHTGECKDHYYIGNRLPGEFCDQNEDCANNNCTEGICGGGKERDRKCDKNEDCLSGLYCNEKKVCDIQKIMYSDCDNSYECENGLLCYKHQCLDVLYSLPVGTKFNSSDINVDEYGPDVFCEYGLTYLDKDNYYVCTAFGYSNPIYNRNQSMVKCNKGDLCYYNYYPLNDSLFSLECSCGYNEEGQGYCPIPHSVNTQRWVSYYRILKHSADNECHTMNRFNCYNNTIEFTRVLKHAIVQNTQGDLYYDSVECAKQVLEDTD